MEEHIGPEDVVWQDPFKSEDPPSDQYLRLEIPRMVARVRFLETVEPESCRRPRVTPTHRFGVGPWQESGSRGYPTRRER